jgi:hypothetical protein
LRNPSRTNLVTRVLGLFREEAADNWMGCFAVVTSRAVKPRLSGKQIGLLTDERLPVFGVETARKLLELQSAAAI